MSRRPDGTPGKPAPALALPVVTYDGPVSIHLNGENVRLLPIRNAHTDGDTLVSFSQHDILAVGDYYRGVGYPFVDLKNGGSLQGLLDGLGATIGRAGPHTKIIPGHGPVTDRNGLIAQSEGGTLIQQTHRRRKAAAWLSARITALCAAALATATGLCANAPRSKGIGLFRPSMSSIRPAAARAPQPTSATRPG
jgi:glyoxylase-like metal-dependent hydrolase (beta-lactamase superfamily II)